MFFLLLSFSSSFWSKALNYHKNIQQIDENNFSAETFFDNTPEIFRQQIVRNNYVLFSTDVYVNNCMFISTINLEDDKFGGAIRVRCAYVKLLLEYTTFDSCSARSGGAIYMYMFPSPNKGCIISFVCSSKCYATQGWNFDYIRVSENIDYLLESSIILSGKNDYTSSILSHKDAHFIGRSINLSNNIYSSKGFSVSTTSGKVIQIRILFSSFANNTLKQSKLIAFAADCYQHLNFTNIIGNAFSPIYSDDTLIYFGGTPTLYSCSIFDNTGGNIFYTRDYIKVNFYNCYIPNDQKLFYNDGIIYYNDEKDFFTNNLSLLQTKLCIVHFYPEKTKHSSINYYNHKTINKLFRY